MPNPAPLGVFDSGVGGLTVVRAIQKRLPAESLIYLGDTARVPYGTKSPEIVTRFSRQISRFLMAHQVKAIVVGCNTASAHALPALRAELPIPALGVIEPGVRAAVSRSTTGRIGIIATPGTIGSGAYQNRLRALRPQAEIHACPTPLLVPLIEEDWISHPATQLILKDYLRPLLRHQIDTLVLGCTHYPLLTDQIRAIVGPEVHLVDSASTCAADIETLLRERDWCAPADRIGHTKLFLTDLPLAFERMACRFLETENPRVEVVEVDSLT